MSAVSGSAVTGGSRRFGPGLVLLATASLLLAACGGTDDESTGAPGDSGNSDTADGAFPVEIEGALGTTVIDEEPERVVTLGWGQDIVYSLGVVPVGIEQDVYAGDENGFTPWYREALEADDAELPETISNAPELDIDAIIELEPDLVLAPQSGLEQDVYDQLSKFTDVVAYPGQPWQTPWQEQIEISAQALGRSDRADGLIAEVEGYFADAAAEYPEFAEYDIAYVSAGTQPGALEVYPDFDTRVAYLTGLGFTIDPGIADLEVDSDFFTTSLGLDNADMLNDVDVLFTWFNDEEEQQVTEAQPLFAQIPAVERGSYVPMVDSHLVTATSTTTPLSVPWGLEAYLPMISEAVAQVEVGS